MKAFKISFDRLNEIADRYFSENRQPEDRARLWEMLYSAYTPETEEQRKNKIKEFPSYDHTDDWGYVFGVNCTIGVFYDAIEEAIGEKKLQSGENSSSGYKPGKGMKFSTYFISLLKDRMKTKFSWLSLKETTETGGGIYKPTGIKAVIVGDEDADNDEKEIEIVDSETTNVGENNIVIIARFVSDLIKSGKAIELTPYIYSKLLINYTRKFSEYFNNLNTYSKILLEPLAADFTSKMTTLTNGMPEDFLELCYSELSQFVFENDLAENLYKNNSDIKILKDKAVYVFCGVLQNTFHYRQKKFYEIIRDSIGEALRD